MGGLTCTSILARKTARLKKEALYTFPSVEQNSILVRDHPKHCVDSEDSIEEYEICGNSMTNSLLRTCVESSVPAAEAKVP
jgi:hypothetical protein